MTMTRPARPEDEPFLFELFAAVRRADYAALGWPEERLLPLLAMQYEAQCSAYRARYPALRQDIVILEGAPVGQLTTAVESDGALRLADLTLSPMHRGRGIGTTLLQELQAEAAESGKPLRLSVASDNPALRLYLRLGFAIVGERPPYVAMEWRPGPEASET